MIELEVKLGPKTGLETVQNGEHAVVEVAPPDGSNQAPLVRVTQPRHGGPPQLVLESDPLACEGPDQGGGGVEGRA